MDSLLGSIDRSGSLNYEISKLCLIGLLEALRIWYVCFLSRGYQGANDTKTVLNMNLIKAINRFGSKPAWNTMKTIIYIEQQISLTTWATRLLRSMLHGKNLLEVGRRT